MASDLKSEIVATRLSERERLQVEAAAALNAETVGAYIRRAVLEAARERLARELREDG